MNSILYVGCPHSERASTERVLAGADIAVVWADNMSKAIGEFERRQMPVVVDLTRGAAVLQAARELLIDRPDALIFAVVDDRRPDLTTEAVLTGVADVFARPPGARRLATAIERERRYEANPSARPLSGPSPDPASDAIYSHSPSMREVVAVMSRAATMRAGVLIHGEDGTGRQVVARAIHGARANGAFVSVDCAAHDADELEAALFGERACQRNGEASDGLERVSRQSRLYAALGGTCYLKNLVEAPGRLQARLARLLRDREVTLAETGATVPFDVRPMAGVDPGVDAAVEEGRVREELFKRLSVIRIDMPALRNRLEDIPALANYFLREICGTRRLPPKTLSRPALALISALPWRGNAVELRLTLESIVDGPSAGKGISLEEVLTCVRLDGGSVAFAERGTLRQARARFEREYIGHVLEQHRGRVSEAAKTLGIQRTNLYRKLRSLRVDKDRRRREP